MPTQELTINTSNLFVPEFNNYLENLTPKERSIMTYAVFHNPYAPSDINDPKTLPILLHIGGLTQEQYDVIRIFGLGSDEDIGIVKAIIVAMDSIENIKEDEGNINDRLDACTLPFNESSCTYLSDSVYALKKNKNKKDLSTISKEYLYTTIDYMRKHCIFK